MSGNKILVTGASGLVGGNLVRILVKEKGEQVKVLLRDSSNTLALDDLEHDRVILDHQDRGLNGIDFKWFVVHPLGSWQIHGVRTSAGRVPSESG